MMFLAGLDGAGGCGCSGGLGADAAPATDNICPCTDDSAPVCGADGNTYTNACWAACAGTTVASPGECPPKKAGMGMLLYVLAGAALLYYVTRK